jgi:predicted nuclease of restriction endonuclease-like (RecB) superfamily
VRLLGVESAHARVFYETEALRGGWTSRQLDRQIQSQFYERTALSRNKAAILRKGRGAKADDAVTAEAEIKDPFVLEFLDLKDEYSESDLEAALIARLETFLLELGDDFAFIGHPVNSPEEFDSNPVEDSLLPEASGERFRQCLAEWELRLADRMRSHYLVNANVWRPVVNAGAG